MCNFNSPLNISQITGLVLKLIFLVNVQKVFFTQKLFMVFIIIHDLLIPQNCDIISVDYIDNTIELAGFLFSSLKQQGNYATIRTEVQVS